MDLLIQQVRRRSNRRVEKARILTGMADSEPDVAKWKASTDNWAQLRNMMQGMQKKPAEYYEAVYETAHGLFEQSKLSSSQKEANDMKAQARQLLKATSAGTEPERTGHGGTLRRPDVGAAIAAFVREDRATGRGWLPAWFRIDRVQDSPTDGFADAGDL